MIQELTLKMVGGFASQEVHVQQLDSNSRFVRIHLSGFKIPEGDSAVIYGKKPDGKVTMNDCVVEDESTVLCPITSQTIACYGKVKAQLYIFGEDYNIRTQPFIINVSKTVYDENAIESSNELGTLEKLIAEVKGIDVFAEINEALAEAKASGEFDGEDGKDYVLTEDDKEEIADMTAERLTVNEDGEIVAKPDWNAAEGEQGHILNRTHWVDDNGAVEILPECQPVYDENEQMYILPTVPAFVVGETYTVNWNGAEYTSVCQDCSVMMAGAVALGNVNAFLPNMGFTGNNEPFVIAIVNGMGIVVPLDGTTELTLSIYQGGVVIHKLDNKFIDAEWMATSKKVRKAVFDADIRIPTSKHNIFNKPLFEIVEGEIYNVEWDGVMYECIGHIKQVEADGYKGAIGYIGNTSLTFFNVFDVGEDTGEPFCYECDLAANEYNSEIVSIVSGSVNNSDHHMKVIAPVNEPNKLPKKFLPDEVVAQHDMGWKTLKTINFADNVGARDVDTSGCTEIMVINLTALETSEYQLSWYGFTRRNWIKCAGAVSHFRYMGGKLVTITAPKSDEDTSLQSTVFTDAVESTSSRLIIHIDRTATGQIVVCGR